MLDKCLDLLKQMATLQNRNVGIELTLETPQQVIAHALAKVNVSLMVPDPENPFIGEASFDSTSVLAICYYVFLINKIISQALDQKPESLSDLGITLMTYGQAKQLICDERRKVFYERGAILVKRLNPDLDEEEMSALGEEFRIYGCKIELLNRLMDPLLQVGLMSISLDFPASGLDPAQYIKYSSLDADQYAKYIDWGKHMARCHLGPALKALSQKPLTEASLKSMAGAAMKGEFPFTEELVTPLRNQLMIKD